MNLNIYKEYKFINGKFTATKTGNEYEFSLKDDDRFYIYLKPYIINEKVEGLTHLMIDEIVISDANNTFFEEKSFTLNATILAKDQNNFMCPFTLTMKKAVKLNDIKTSKKSYRNGEWSLTLYELEIPYKTDIDIAEVTED
ncbi:MAG: hypothetical protein IJN64_08310 [Lachnospiraceae bacterium]|nr:hypothetical protein [Lachnospiraceae bacterium]